MRVCVVGTGPMGARQAWAFTELLGAEHVAMACRDDRDVARLTELDLPAGVRHVPFGPHLASSFDLAVVAVQTEQHFAIVQALDLPLLVEKPLCQTPDQARELLTRTHRTFVGHSSRMEAGAAPFHSLVRQGRAAEIRELVVAVAEPHLRRGEAPLPMIAGRLYDVAVHAVAAVADLLPAGPPVYAIGSLASNWAEAPGLAGEAVWHGRPFLKVDIRSDRPAMRTIQAVGEDGRVRWDVTTGQTVVGVRLTEGEWTPVTVGGPPPQLALAREVVRALQTGTPSVLDAVHGLRVMHIAGAVVAEAVRAAGMAWDWTWVR